MYESLKLAKKQPPRPARNGLAGSTKARVPNGETRNFPRGITSDKFRFGNLTSTHRDEWQRLLSESHHTTPFHSPEWEQALRLGFPSETSIYWGLWLNEELVAVWPTSLMPVLGGMALNPRGLRSDYFGAAPAIKDGVEMTVLRPLTSYIVGFLKRHRALFWSLRIPRSSPFVEVSPLLGFQIKPSLASTLCSIVLDTTQSPEVVWKKSPPGGLRTCVKKAEREGLEVKESSDQSDLRGYFGIKKNTYFEVGDIQRFTRRQVAQWSFWLAIHRLLVLGGKAKLFITRHRGRIIAGAIIFFQNNKAYLWNMSSMPDTWRMRPNHILMWNIIEWAHDSGIDSIDLGSVSRTRGVHYFIERNFGNYEQADQVVLTLPINKFLYQILYQLQTGLETANRKLHVSVPLTSVGWYRASGIA